MSEIQRASGGTDEIGTDSVGTDEIDQSISPTWTGTHDYTSGDITLPTVAGIQNATTPTQGQIVYDTTHERAYRGVD